MPIDLQPHQFRQLGSLEFLAKQAVEGFITGLHRSPYHGFSVEFAEHRLYNPGESMRHVDWKLYARSDRYYVKRWGLPTVPKVVEKVFAHADATV